MIEIVDQNSAAWDHINIDHIVFSDIPPEPFLQSGTEAATVAKALNLTFAGAEEEAVEETAASQEPWPISRYTRLTGLRLNENGYSKGLTRSTGDPLTIEGPLGKGRM